MGRSVSYPNKALVVTFKDYAPGGCDECKGFGYTEHQDESGEGLIHEECEACGGTGDGEDFDSIIEDFQQHLATLFPSVQPADDWIDREDHVLAENKLARFGMSEYCGLVAYWIVPQTLGVYDQLSYGLCEAWIRKNADKFVAAFGELSKVGTASNGESFYRRIDK